MGQIHFLSPNRDMSQPPRIPPATRQIIPTVPYASPTCEVESPRPPALLASSKKGGANFRSMASAKR